MVCNTEKTEIMVLNANSELRIQVDGKEIQTQQTMKVLGIQFDANPSWEKQVENIKSKTNITLHGLRIIKNTLTRLR